ncbi:radical SAM protein [Candidatus Uhrbacteria bacterium]|nr:radical SAM protein [Candidatus Uhrbacteria bacterium]
MAQRNRSRNPDLLFREVMDERIERTARFESWRTAEPDTLDRITVFVTHRCNLQCGYCNGPHLTWKIGDGPRKREMLRRDLTVAEFRRLLQEAMGHATIRHIHFTGGEATAHPDLLAFITAATEAGILSSITTNGTADPDVYRALIAAGLTEIRVSIDSDSAAAFDHIVRIPGSFDRVVASIREIVRLRDEEHQDIFLVLNACVGSMNLDAIERILAFLMTLEPDDIKLLIIIQEKAFILDHESRALVDRLRAMLVNEPPGRYPLLRQKIERLFDPHASGLADEETQTVMKHCFIPLTERTIDGTHYYPCSIYLRHYGKPLGSLQDPFEVQQQRIREFVRYHDCRADPICVTNCTNCCKVFNVRANLANVEDVEELIEVAEHVAEEDISAMRVRLEGIIAAAAPDERPYMIVKPHGQAHRATIFQLLLDEGLTIASSQRIGDWMDVARYLYTWPLTDERIRHAIQVDRAFRKVEHGPADLLRFANAPTPEALERLKLLIRARIPTRRYRINVGGKRWWIRITAAHTPNPGDVVRENAILAHLIAREPRRLPVLSTTSSCAR